jgi:hypothetical protein
VRVWVSSLFFLYGGRPEDRIAAEEYHSVTTRVLGDFGDEEAKSDHGAWQFSV